MKRVTPRQIQTDAIDIQPEIPTISVVAPALNEGPSIGRLVKRRPTGGFRAQRYSHIYGLELAIAFDRFD